jgi:hypothetical protein
VLGEPIAHVFPEPLVAPPVAARTKPGVRPRRRARWP